MARVARVVRRGLVLSWTKLLQLRWHQWARLVATALLADQALGTVTGIPSDSAIVIACIGALFAPVPSERK